MKNNNVQNLVRASLMLAVVIVFQFTFKNVPQASQFFVGPLVNTVLLITTYVCGTKWGVVTGILTPIFAFMVGQLAASFAPFIPFIAVGNIIYVLIFGFLKQRTLSQIIGIIIGSLTKYIFLYFSAVKLTHMFNLNIPPKILDKLAVAMGIPQLITALIGGALAFAIIGILTRRKVVL